MKRLSEEQIELIELGYQRGLSGRAIAEELGLSRQSVHYHRPFDAPRPRVITPELQQKIIALYQQGKRVKDITATTKIHAPAIYQILKRHSVPLHGPGLRPSPNLEQALAAYFAGETLKAIYHKYHVLHPTIFNALRKRGLPRRPKRKDNKP
jgi:hypothetical protein